MDERKMRCGIVGCGGISRSHAEFYRDWQEAELVACADPHAAARVRMCEIVSTCRQYEDGAALLACEPLDLLVIATRACLHHPLVFAAVQQRVRAILCEKPMALDLRQAQEMVRVCRERGVRLAIGHQRRYDPQYALARQMIQDGSIGVPLAAEVYWPCCAEHLLRGHCRRIDGGGFVLYLGTHVFDLLDFYLGPVQRVLARLGKKDPGADIEDSAVCSLTFREGVCATVHLGEFLYDVCSSRPGGAALRVFITGTRGTLTFGDFSLSVWHRAGEGICWREIPCGDAELGFQRLHAALYHALRTGSPTECDAEKALAAHAVAMACYASAYTGEPVCPAQAPLDSPLEQLNAALPDQPWPMGLFAGPWG